MKNNIFTEEVVNQVLARINNLTAETTPEWGTMAVGQMLAHCNVSYEMLYQNTHKKPNMFVKFFLKTFIKNTVVSDKPFHKNGKTAPQFLIKDSKDFEVEKERLVVFLKNTQKLGEDYFDGKESDSFGKLSKQEWNNLFYKHINHHLTQFGV